MAASDKDTTATLEQRLEYLTSITTPYSADTPLMRPGVESIQQSVASIKSKLNQVVAERRALGEFLQKRKYYAQLRDIISSHTNTAEHSSSSALDLDMGLGLDPASKKEIVLAAEDEILALADQLREIDTLKAELDSQAMNGLDQRIAALSPIEFTQITQSQISSALKEEFMTLLNEYNEYVSLVRSSLRDLLMLSPKPKHQIETLSQMFLYYDSVLNAISAKLDAEGL
ncbi:hypothetical protein CcCBS67573_g00060 [Chytriomyces confervae]|uniref:Uncharacterized protein n=1 Tax=Chytriomyces confervae TaxID=246404 RepID=A0A507FUJ4_9FUNG|nr:hypothetical protein CcCBS67573_g00060 [Chytriomyces confervae]